MPETIETDLEEQPAAPRSSGLEQQLAVMQEQIADLARQVQRLNGDPDAPVTRGDLYAALDELRASPQTPAADGAQAAAERRRRQRDRRRRPRRPRRAARRKGRAERQEEEREAEDRDEWQAPGGRGAEEQPRRRGYFPDA